MRSLEDGVKTYGLNFRSTNIAPLSQYGKLCTRTIIPARIWSDGKIMNSGNLGTRSLNNCAIQFDSIDPFVTTAQHTGYKGNKYITDVYKDLSSRTDLNFIRR